MTYQHPHPPISSVVLNLSFDADQHGADLGHVMSRDAANAVDPNPHKGPHASSLYLEAGEQVFVQITGSGSKAGKFDSFQVVNCVVITRPRMVQLGENIATRYAAPSPFLQSMGACYPLALDFYGIAEDPGISQIAEADRVVTQYWKHTLDVGLSPGMWDLELVLTVRIKRGPGSVEDVRVFSFDPEAEVGGTGTMK